MTKASMLIKQGRASEVWRKYCGFLDLGLPEFMAIQSRLLSEQLQLVANSGMARVIMDNRRPRDVEEFRRRTRITTYEDYAPYLAEKREDVLSETPVAWAHTSGRSGRFKWVPYTARAFHKFGEGSLAAMLLATTRQRGLVRVEPGDVAVYNIAARPYISGYSMISLAEHFDFTFVPSVDETEHMSFQERIQVGFQTGLRTGIDIIGSISSVLVKVGEQFAEGARSGGMSTTMLHPAVLFRLGRAVLRSRLAKRPMLPKDLWRVKGILVGGTDTSIYRSKIVEYWGVEPHESYGCTEVSGVMAAQAWDRKGLYFLPDAGFYEFIPEEEWARSRSDEEYIPRTVLLDEVECDKRYELVVTNFYGGPFLRYRLHDLVKFVSLRDEQAGIELPSMVFAGRDADLIDLAGFTGLIDEKLVWQAIANTGIAYEEWAIRKEWRGAHAGLHLYIELHEDWDSDEVAQRVHEQLKQLNSFYADLEGFLEVRPLQVTLLKRGAFLRYMRQQHEAGADLSHLKPPHMNARDQVIADLLQASEAES